MKVALENVKNDLLENVVLDLPNPYKPYVLEVDSSEFAVGGVLSQHNDLNELRPVAFFSRKLQGERGKGQVGWSIREKETYAIVLVLQKFRSWVASSQVQILVLTDHESLQSPDAQKYASACDHQDDVMDDFVKDDTVASIWNIYDEELPYVNAMLDAYNHNLFALRRRRKKRRGGPRPVLRSEVPQPLFFKKWDYSQDPEFGPVVSQLSSGRELPN